MDRDADRTAHNALRDRAAAGDEIGLAEDAAGGGAAGEVDGIVKTQNPFVGKIADPKGAVLLDRQTDRGTHAGGGKAGGFAGEIGLAEDRLGA